MTVLAKVFGVISLVSLFLAGVGAITYYLIEFISSFLISTINMVEIGNILWKIIYVCFGSAVCFFVLSHLISPKHRKS